MTIRDDNTLDDAPGETVATWIRLVRTMDAAMLASFVVRTWRTSARRAGCGAHGPRQDADVS